MILQCPTKRCVWGVINTQKNLEKYIAKSGQFFGQDLSGRACDFNKTMPCDKTLYEYMGWGNHKGIDIPVATGTEVFSSTNGIVTRVSDDPTQGIGIVIWDKEQNIEIVYWHLQKHIAQLSDIIKAGQLIAYSDNTGYSLGPHLHFQVNLTNEHGKTLNAVDPLNSFIWNTDMLRMIKLDGDSKDIWLVTNDNKRSLIYNQNAFQLIGGNIDLVEKLNQDQFNAISDSGIVLAGIKQE